MGLLLGHSLHVERLELSRETVQEHWYTQDVGHAALSGLSNVVTNGMVDHLRVALLVLDDVTIGVLLFVLNAVFVEPLNRVYIGHAQEWTSGCGEVGVELLDQCCGGRVGEEAVDCFTDLDAFQWAAMTYRIVAYNFFNMSHQIVEVNERKFSLQVGIFTQMSSRVAANVVRRSCMIFQLLLTYLFSARKLS